MKAVFLLVFCGVMMEEWEGGKVELGKERILDESITLLYERSFQDETQDMKDFFTQLSLEEDKNSETIKINSSMNSDNSQTTGNLDAIQDIKVLLPTYEVPIIDKEVSLKAKQHQEFIKSMV